jgi:NAD(P)-dependent dehydrogenase (short-subunit alcohol dehydrogenase family)
VSPFPSSAPEADPRLAEIPHLRGGAAVITGAGSGFGLECARLAAQRGMHPVLVDVQADALAAAEAEVTALATPQGGRVLARRVDVSSDEQMTALAAEVLEAFGAPRLVFNNAGVGGAGGLLWEASVKDWDWVLGVNVRGVIHGVRLFTPMMLAAAKADPAWRGHIVNTASMAGLVAPPNMGVYNASKHAVVALSETLYQDLSLVTEQIRAHVLCPFFVPTGIARSQRNRPTELSDGDAPLTRSQKVAQVMSDKAVGSGKVTAADVARKVFDALRGDQFYIFSHPKALAGVQMRMEDVVLMRNPTDPFKDKPEIRQQLQAALRG